jgi:hypothetical protein
MMTRRDVLALLGMGLPLSALQVPAPQNVRILTGSSNSPSGPAASGFSVDIQVDGQPIVTFYDANAVDCGTYAGPFVTQRCLRATHPLLRNYTVYFRPDANGQRQEIVFEYGGLLASQITGGAAAVATMPPHTVTIRQNGGVVATVRPTTQVNGVTVNGHGWNQRWRWQSAPRPIVRTRQQLIDMGLLLPYDWSMPKVKDQADDDQFLNQTALSLGDMSSNKGFERHMGSVAERPDIGAITAWLASFLAGTTIKEQTVRAQADVAAGTVPWIWRDRVGTGAPVSVYKYPTITGHNNNSSDLANYVQQVGSTVDWGGSYGWTCDSAHQPAALAVMAALTDDPYYLEGLQFQVAWNFAWTRNQRWVTIDGVQHGPWQDGQVRGHAYSLRTMTDAWLLTPDSAPSWLNPKAHYAKLLDETAIVYEYNTITKPRQLGNDQKQLWQHSFAPTTVSNHNFWNQYVLTVYAARCALLGLPRWQPMAEWYFEFCYGVFGNESGWDRRYPANYKRWLGFPEPNNHGDLTAQANATNWSDFYKAQGLPAPIDGNIQVDVTNDGHYRDWYYISMGASACAMMLRLGVTKNGGVLAAYQWLRGQSASLSDGFIPRKWAVVKP